MSKFDFIASVIESMAQKLIKGVSVKPENLSLYLECIEQRDDCDLFIQERKISGCTFIKYTGLKQNVKRMVL